MLRKTQYSFTFHRHIFKKSKSMKKVGGNGFLLCPKKKEAVHFRVTNTHSLSQQSAVIWRECLID